MSALGIEHLHYRLIHAKVLIDDREYVTWLCGSRNYRKAGESKIALDTWYQMEKKKQESPLDFCIRQGWSEYIYQMLLVDFLILNRDRHGANLEVLLDAKHKSVRLAPLFDHGLSFFFSCRNDEQIEKEDVMADKPVQCFVGSASARDNLVLIPSHCRPESRALEESDKDFILAGLEPVMSAVFLRRVWEMIWKRWEFYEDFHNKK